MTLVLLFALGTLALLDSVRMRLLARASYRLDRVLSGAIIDATLKRPEISSQRLAKQALREFDTLRQVLTGPAIVSLFDAPGFRSTSWSLSSSTRGSACSPCAAR